MVSIGALSEQQRQELRRLRRRAVGRVAERAQMVLLSTRGYPVADIAEIFEVGADVVRTWLHRYQQEGAAGLQDRRRPGRPPKDRLARHIVDAQASNPPCNSGLARTCWTAGLLATFLAWRYHLVLAPASPPPAPRGGLAGGPSPAGPGDARAGAPAQDRSGGATEAGLAGPRAGRAGDRAVPG